MLSFPNALRQKQGERSQADFARELKASQSVVSRITNGKRGKGWRVLANIFAIYPDLLPFFISDYADINRQNGKMYKEPTP